MLPTAPIMSKEEAMARVANMDKDKRSQQAIVDLVTGRGKIEKLVHQIPGGLHLTEQLDSESLKKAVFTWLRRVRDFERYEISFAGDYDGEDELRDKGVKPKKSKYADFGWKAGAPLFWRKKGIAEIANLVTNALNDTENIVSVIIEREGVFVVTDSTEPSFSPTSEHWNPVLLIHRQRK